MLLWAQLPSLDSKRTTNATESVHAHYNEHFYAAHPIIFAFVDVITKIQITTYIKIRTLHQPAVVRRSEMDKLTFLMEQYAKYQNGEIYKSYRLQIFDQNRCLTSLQRESDSVLRSFILFIMPVLLLYIKTIPCTKSYFTSPWCTGVTEITYKLTNFWRTVSWVFNSRLCKDFFRAFVGIFSRLCKVN